MPTISEVLFTVAKQMAADGTIDPTETSVLSNAASHLTPSERKELDEQVAQTGWKGSADHEGPAASTKSAAREVVGQAPSEVARGERGLSREAVINELRRLCTHT